MSEREVGVSLQVYTLNDRPDLRPQVFASAFRPPFWPEFMLHDPTSALYYWPHFLDHYLDFAFAGVVEGQVVARAFGVPFALGVEGRYELPDGGWDRSSGGRTRINSFAVSQQS